MKRPGSLANLLPLCRRAGRLALGYDAVKESVQKRNASLILLTEDLSPKTVENIRFTARRAGVPCRQIPLSIEELWGLTGKRAGVAAVTDKGFAEAIAGLLSHSDEKGKEAGQGEND